MTSRLNQRRQRLRAEYGFDFPEDLFAFWAWVNRLAPLAPLQALSEALDVTLVGPFEVLAGRFDGHVSRHSLLLHWRYYDDPPELFTCLAGGSDGLHWGHYLDDPAAGEGCVASYYARDAYELSVDGDNLFEAVRLHLEHLHSDAETYREEDEENAAEYDRDLARLAELRERLMHKATGDRPETGEEYTDLYGGTSEREDRVVAETKEGMGVVVAPERFRPLSVDDERLWRRLRKQDDPAGLVAEARQALREGYPGTALKLGKDLWATGGERRTAYAVELLGAAYTALGRDDLLRVLQTHQANRELPSVDILENEEG
jgi:hypothetical protein